MAYNFAAISPQFDVVAEFKDQPVIPERDDLIIIDSHKMKVVRWVYDYKTEGFSVMVVRDRDFDPYTKSEVRERLLNGDAYTDSRCKYHWRLRQTDGGLVKDVCCVESGEVKTGLEPMDDDKLNRLIDMIANGYCGADFVCNALPVDDCPNDIVRQVNGPLRMLHKLQDAIIRKEAPDLLKKLYNE